MTIDMHESPSFYRLRLRFSLRSLAVLIAIATAFLAAWTSRANRQRRAVREIGECGHVVYRHESPSDGTGPDYTTQPPGPKWLQSLLGDDYFRTVRIVNFGPTDASLNELSDLRHVEIIALDAVHLTPRGFKSFPTLKGLKQLSVYRGHHLNNASMSLIDKFPNLRILEIVDTPIDDACLEHLADLTHLEQLTFDSTHMTDAGIQKLRAALPSTKIIGRRSDYWRSDLGETPIFATNDSLTKLRSEAD